MARGRRRSIGVLSDADLTPAARIRNAALELFATRGVAGTTIRTVAESAGFSAGLVQHHYSTKAELRGAVNEFVVAVATDAFADLAELAPEADLFAELGDRITALVREQPMVARYVGRAVVEGDEAGMAIFATFVDIAREQLGRLDEQRILRPGLDVDWEALHVVVFNLGSLLFAPALDRVLGEPFATDAGLDRWNVAATEHFRRALARPGPDRSG